MTQLENTSCFRLKTHIITKHTCETTVSVPRACFICYFISTKTYAVTGFSNAPLQGCLCQDVRMMLEIPVVSVVGKGVWLEKAVKAKCGSISTSHSRLNTKFSFSFTQRVKSILFQSAKG